MKILCLSDLHSQFDQYVPADLPPADLCLVAGDLTVWGHRGAEHFGEIENAADWLRAMGERYESLFWIPGNHDIGVTAETFASVPKAVCVLNETVTVRGLTLRGVSLTPCFDNPILREVWDYMTASRKVDASAFAFPPVDIVLSHGPPHGVLDGPGRWGSPALLAYINTHQPRLVVCGHIHECGGKQERIGKTLLVNAACHPVVVELEERKEQEPVLVAPAPV